MTDKKRSPPPEKASISKDEDFEVVINDREAMEEAKGKASQSESVSNWEKFEKQYRVYWEQLVKACQGTITYDENQPEESTIYTPQNYESVKKFIDNFNKDGNFVLAKNLSKQECAKGIHNVIGSYGVTSSYHLKKSHGHPDPTNSYKFLLTARITDYQGGYKMTFIIIKKKYNDKTQNWDLFDN